MQQANTQSLPCWYEIVGGTTVHVWQGVIAVYNRTSTTLYKEHKQPSVTLTLTPGIEAITADGYWTCAEITGTLSDGDRFYYHCTNAAVGEQLLKAVKQRHKASIAQCCITVDVDPFRNASAKQRKTRRRRWMQLLRNLSVDAFDLKCDGANLQV